MCNSLFALFFEMVLRIASFIFVAKMLTFIFFVFCRFFSVPLPRFFVFLTLQFDSFYAVEFFWLLCYDMIFFLRCYSFVLLPCFADLHDCFLFQFLAFVGIFVCNCFAVSFGLPVSFFVFPFTLTH